MPWMLGKFEASSDEVEDLMRKLVYGVTSEELFTRCNLIFALCQDWMKEFEGRHLAKPPR